ncbi:hypothetical protein EBB07_15425 [Paenibacillaceae bacterium]|nr:hypothetical protein EBB07_15425 [Paenibacillaceae bacterium]
MKSFRLFFCVFSIVLLLIGCAPKKIEITDQMIDKVIQDNNLTVIDIKKTSQGAVFIFFKTQTAMGAYNLYIQDNNLVTGRGGVGRFGEVGEIRDPDDGDDMLFKSEENKTLLTGFIDGAMGLIIDDENLLNNLKHFDVLLDGELKKRITVNKSERAYIIEIESFVRTKNQVISVEFYDSNNNKIMQ